MHSTATFPERERDLYIFQYYKMVVLLKVSLISAEVSHNWAGVGCHILISDMNINNNMSSVMKGVGTVTCGGVSKGNYRKKNK